MVEVVNSQNYQVQLIDYGKSDIIPEARVQTLPDSVIHFPILAFRLQLRYMQPLNELSTNESLRRKIIDLLLASPIELRVIEREAGQLHHVKINSESVLEGQIAKFIAECKHELNDSGRGGSIASDKMAAMSNGTLQHGNAKVAEFVYELNTKYGITIESAIDAHHVYLSVTNKTGEYQSLQVCLLFDEIPFYLLILKERLNAHCENVPTISTFANHATPSATIYGFKMPRGNWTRARICELLTSTDAEMELLDQNFITRRVHIDQLVELTNQELCEFPAQEVKCKVVNKMAPKELKEMNKNIQLFGIFGKGQFEPAHTVIVVYDSGKQIKRDFETPKKKPTTQSINAPESPPIATIKQGVNATSGATTKYSRVPILPGAVYDVYPLQLESIDSFIFAQRTKLNSIFSQSLDSDLADYCHAQKSLSPSEITAGDAVAINDAETSTWRRGEIVWVDAAMVKVYLVDLGTYMKVSISSVFHIPEIFIKRQPSSIIRCTLHGLVDPAHEDSAFELLQHFCDDAKVLTVSVIAQLECRGLEYQLVNIWSLSMDFHKMLEKYHYLRSPTISAPFHLTSWIYPIHPKKGSETEWYISNISELAGQKVIYIQQLATRQFHEQSFGAELEQAWHLSDDHVTPGCATQIGIMSVRNGFYRVCVEQGEKSTTVVRLVDTGEMLQTPNLTLIKTMPPSFESRLLSQLVNALPVVPSEEIDLDEQLEVLRNQLGQRLKVLHIGQRDGKGIVEFKFKRPSKTLLASSSSSSSHSTAFNTMTGAFKSTPYSGLYEVKFTTGARCQSNQIAWPRWAHEKTQDLTVK